MIVSKSLILGLKTDQENKYYPKVLFSMQGKNKLFTLLKGRRGVHTLVWKFTLIFVYFVEPYPYVHWKLAYSFNIGQNLPKKHISIMVQMSKTQLYVSDVLNSNWQNLIHDKCTVIYISWKITSLLVCKARAYKASGIFRTPAWFGNTYM